MTTTTGPTATEPATAAAPAGDAMPGKAYFIRRLIAYRPVTYWLNASCWIVFHSWYLVLGLLAKLFFDTLTGAQTAIPLAGVVALVLVVGLARMAVLWGAWKWGAPWGFMVRRLVQHNLFASVLRRPGAAALPGTVGETQSTMRDDVETIALTTDWLFDLIGAVLFAAGGIAILVWIDPRVTALVFLPVLAVLAVSYAVRLMLDRVRQRSRAATADVTGLIGEMFGAVQAIQVACAEDAVVARLRRLGDVRRRMMLRDRFLGIMLDASFANIASIGVGLTLLVAAAQMRAGSFSVGDFALFATYLMQVAALTGLFGYLVTTYRQSGVAYTRAATVLGDEPPTRIAAHAPLHLRDRPPAPAAPARDASHRLDRLDVIGLSLRHPGSDRGVEDVSFSIGRGETVAVTGRTGAGKTTLLRAVLGLLRSDAGEVRWNGETVTDPATFLVHRVAYTPQVPTLLTGTVRDNVLLGLPDDGRADRAVRAAALDSDVGGFPDGLDTVVGARGVRLSGGQVQRTAAARMFARETDLVFVDDLASALDQETEELLWQRMRASGTACLAATHHRRVLEAADRIVLLVDGRVEATGSYAELVENSAEFRRLGSAT